MLTRNRDSGAFSAWIFLCFLPIVSPARAPAQTPCPKKAMQGWAANLYLDPQDSRHQASVERLANCGALGVPSLNDCLNSNSENAQSGALSSLSLMDKQDVASAVSSIARLTGSPEYRIASKAIRLLGGLGKFARPAVPALGGVLSARDAELRYEAVFALKNLGLEAGESLAAVLEFIRSGKMDGRGEAMIVSLLASLGSRSLDDIKSGLNDLDPEVRRVTALALGSMGAAGIEADTALVQIARSDPDPRVRESAIAALREIYGDLPDRSMRSAVTHNPQFVMSALAGLVIWLSGLGLVVMRAFKQPTHRPPLTLGLGIPVVLSSVALLALWADVVTHAVAPRIGELALQILAVTIVIAGMTWALLQRRFSGRKEGENQ